jgi:hypothetical protein
LRSGTHFGRTEKEHGAQNGRLTATGGIPAGIPPVVHKCKDDGREFYEAEDK